MVAVAPPALAQLAHRRRGARHREVRAQAPHHLASDALDPHELVDRAERM